MKKHLILFLFAFCFLNPGKAQPVAGNKPAEKLNYKIITAENKTWGYDVYRNGKLFVHQPNIPGLQGNGGFKTIAGAESVAKEVIKKIKNGEIPPTITTDELKKLNAI